MIAIMIIPLGLFLISAALIIQGGLSEVARAINSIQKDTNER